MSTCTCFKVEFTHVFISYFHLNLHLNTYCWLDWARTNDLRFNRAPLLPTELQASNMYYIKNLRKGWNDNPTSLCSAASSLSSSIANPSANLTYLSFHAAAFTTRVLLFSWWRPRESNSSRQEHCKCSPQLIAAPIYSGLRT